MKSKDLRKLIGKEIEWIEGNCSWRGGFVRKGIVIEVSGRNVLVDQCGINDWKWIPDMFKLKELNTID